MRGRGWQQREAEAICPLRGVDKAYDTEDSDFCSANEDGEAFSWWWEVVEQVACCGAHGCER